LFNVFFEEGFVVDGMEEPVFGQYANKAKMFAMVFQKIPPAIVVRMRLLN